MENFNHILVFKTNIKTPADRETLKPLFEKHESIKQWNVDLYDEDYVLRIISYTLNHQYIIKLLRVHGYYCEELT